MKERRQPATRVQTSLLAGPERRALTWLCGKLPRWVTPDLLTLLALGSAILIFAGYALSAQSPLWLWMAVAGYVTHWFGDSLDGSLARHRRIERPDYGYFIDHSMDGLSTLLVMAGIGLSPYVRADVALLAAAAYLLLSIHTFLLATVSRVFRLSQAGLGPTEVRLILIALTALMFFVGPGDAVLNGFSAFDLIVGAGAVVGICIFLVQTLRVGRELSRRDAQQPDGDDR